MKRLITVLLIFALFLPGCGKKVEKPEEAPVDLPDGIAAEKAADFTVAGGKLWILAEGEVRSAGEEPETLDLPDGFAPAFLSAGETGPVLCTSDGEIFWDGETAVLSIPEEKPAITSFAVAGDTAVAAYLHTSEGWGEGNRLVFFNRSTHDCITMNPVREGFCRVVPGDEESVWILNFGFADVAWSAYRFNLRTMQPDAPAVFSTGWDIASAAFDSGEDALFLIQRMKNGDTEVLALERLISGDERPVRIGAPKPSYGEAVKIALHAGRLFALDKGGTMTLLSDWKPEDSGQVVTIAVIPSEWKNNFTLSERCAERLALLGGEEGISVNILRLTEDQISIKLLAGDPDIDLFWMDGERLFPEKPFWAPLEGYAAIAEQTEKLTETAIRFSSWNGHLFGIPMDGLLGYVDRYVNEDKAAVLGLDKQEMDALGMTDGTWTLETFGDLALRAKEKGILVSQFFLLGMDDYAARYFVGNGDGTGTLTDENGKALRSMLSLAKKLKDGGMTDDFAPEEDALLKTRRGTPEEILVQIPTFDGERRYPISLHYMMMNAASENKDAAAEILAMAADPDNGLYPLDISGFLPYRDAEERLAALGRDFDFDLYRSVEPYFVTLPGMVGEWVNFAGTETWKYLEDEQDLDYTVDRIVERAKMVLEG